MECIIHQSNIGLQALNLKQIFAFNIEFEWLWQAAKYEIPVKYASPASVYGNEQGIVVHNYYALSKVTTDYWVRDMLVNSINSSFCSMSVVMAKIIKEISKSLVSLSRN